MTDNRAAMRGPELRRIRKRLGASQAGLAALLGTTKGAVARQERSEIAIREPVARLARVLIVLHERYSLPLDEIAALMQRPARTGRA